MDTPGWRRGRVAMAERLITPDELRRITEEKEMEKMREALEKKRKMDEERHHFHDTFMHQDIPRDDPRARARFSALVRGAAERGEREVLALRFPSEYCPEGGRAINNFEPDWPETLTGFAQRGLRVLAEGARAAGLQAARPDHGFPGRHAGRRRRLSSVVSRTAGDRGRIRPAGD
jgi:hypothetical protein